jgi:hypothetical protein
MISLVLFLGMVAKPAPGVRKVSATPCEVVDVRVALGMSTLLEFEMPPQMSFHADKEHFEIHSTDSANRVLAIIPKVSSSEIQNLMAGGASANTPRALAALLDEYFKTNLFVFFKNSSRLIFRLRFSTKDEADYVVSVKQIFKEGCAL